MKIVGKIYISLDWFYWSCLDIFQFLLYLCLFFTLCTLLDEVVPVEITNENFPYKKYTKATTQKYLKEQGVHLIFK